MQTVSKPINLLIPCNFGLGVDTFEQCPAESVGGNYYRLEGTPMMQDGDEESKLYLGDFVEVEQKHDGSFVFLRRAKRSSFQHYEWFFPEYFFDATVEWNEYRTAIEAVGGKWERIAGGTLVVHVPHYCTVDPTALLNVHFANAYREYKLKHSSHNQSHAGKSTDSWRSFWTYLVSLVKHHVNNRFGR